MADSTEEAIKTVRAYGNDRFPLVLDPSSVMLLDADMLTVATCLDTMIEQLSDNSTRDYISNIRIYEMHFSMLRALPEPVAEDDRIRFYAAALDTAMIWELG